MSYRLDITPGDMITCVEIHEGHTWPSGTPRPTLTVRVHHPREAYGGLQGAEVSWPSTSDRRPELAFMLAGALHKAFQIAGDLNEEAGLQPPDVPERTAGQGDRKPHVKRSQDDVLRFVERHLTATLPEIAEGLDISEATARRKADGLVYQGRLICVAAPVTGPPRRYAMPADWTPTTDGEIRAIAAREVQP